MTKTDTDSTGIQQRPCHEALDGEIAQWRCWWGELAEMGQPHLGEMGCRLTRFRELLAQHFTEEENGMFLSLAVEADSSVVSQIAELQDEHQAFLKEMDRLIERLQSENPEIDRWGQARDEFEEFLDRLNSHEEAEEELIRQVR